MLVASRASPRQILDVLWRLLCYLRCNGIRVTSLNVLHGQSKNSSKLNFGSRHYYCYYDSLLLLLSLLWYLLLLLWLLLLLLWQLLLLLYYYSHYYYHYFNIINVLICTIECLIPCFQPLNSTKFSFGKNMKWKCCSSSANQWIMFISLVRLIEGMGPAVTI